MKRIIQLTIVVLLLCGCSTCNEKVETKKTAPQLSVCENTEQDENVANNNVALEAGIYEVEAEKSYIGNINSKKFHLISCHTLPEPKNRIYFAERSEAEEKGYVPCRNCYP